MPFLRVEEGSCPGQILEVEGESTVIGRHPACQIVLDNAAISRQHAQITESHGTYFLEDLRSRNQTLLNGESIERAMELKDGDTIQLCGLSFRFFLDFPADRPLKPLDTGEKQEPIANGATLSLEALGASSSSILGTVSVGDASSRLLGVRPEQKLRAVLDMGKSLGHAFELRDVLDNALKGLFEVFPSADEGIVIFQNGTHLDIKAARARRTGPAASAIITTPAISTTIVRRALESGEAILSANVLNDSRFAAADSVAAIASRSIMCVPLLDRREEAFAVIQLNSLDSLATFTQDDLGVLASLGGQIGLAIENARLHGELVAQRDLQRELDFAMQVQLGFLPSQPPEVPRFEFFDHYEAAQRVGGDYFDYVQLPEGRIAVTVGDVAGKGVPAALLMARLFASARYQLMTRPSPAAALTALNTEMVHLALGHRFITCIFAVIDPEKSLLTIANAGHMPPIVRTANEEILSLGKGEAGMPIGIARDQEFVETQYELNPDDLVLMYTDGVTEAMDADGNLYGRTRLVDAALRAPGGIRETIESIVGDVIDFVGDSPQRDDICLVGFRYLPS